MRGSPAAADGNGAHTWKDGGPEGALADSSSSASGGQRADQPDDRPDDVEVDQLPPPVLARARGLAADALGRVPVEHLPAPLRRVASFAPARRVKLAGTQILGSVVSDETFRSHLVVQVRALGGDAARRVEEGDAAATDDPVETAALAFLLRPPGWSSLVRAVAAPGEEPDSVAGRRLAEQVERVRRQLQEAQRALVDARARHREQLDQLKRDNADLRRTLGETRRRLRAAHAESEQAAHRASEQTSLATAATAAAEAEARRLRTRLSDLESELLAARRRERGDRGTEALRARLLLDTLIDAGQGLRRELALPATEALPADAVAEAQAREGHPGARASGGHGALAADDPALLAQLVELPRMHLVVDGYNVTKATWPDLSLERQRDRLLAALAPLVARSGAEVTVVFDAAESRERPLTSAPRGVRVVYSAYGVIADDVIRDLVAAEPRGRPVVVVTDDQAVARDVAAAGARVTAAAALSRLVSRSR